MLNFLCRLVFPASAIKTLSVRVLSILVFTSIAAAAGAQQGGNVRIEILTDHSKVTPGSTFNVGVLYKMEPDWHIYWSNYGDAGIETVVNWTVPEGVTVGPLQWEPPLRFEVSGIASYGYAETAVLWNEVTVAEDFNADNIELNLNTDWLECENVCIPGGATGSITIGVGDEMVPAQAERLNLARMRAPHPTPITDLEGLTIDYDATNGPSGEKGILVSWSEDFAEKNLGKAVKVEGRGHESSPYFFTWPGFPALIGRGQVYPENRSIFFAFQDENETIPSDARLNGLLHLALPETDGSSAENENEEAASEHEAVLVWDVRGSESAANSAPPAAGTGSLTDATTSDDATTAGKFSFASQDYSAQGLSSVQKKSIFVVLTLAFIGGLILNVMPCVLPVISLKIFSMVRQSGESRGHMAFLGGAYTLGVLVSFWILAGVIIALQMLGADAGWGNQFQFPYFNYAMFLVLYIFGLSLLGVFEIEAPASVQQGASEAAQKEGFAGAFFSGGLSTVLATPCMAPILAPVVAFAITLPPLANLGLFSTVALGLASPYLILSLNPGWTRFMPKPGNWMVHFQRIVAFTMITAALFPMWVLMTMAESSIITASDLFWRLGVLTILVGFSAYLWGTFSGLTAGGFQRWSIRSIAVLLPLLTHFSCVHPALQSVSVPPTSSHVAAGQSGTTGTGAATVKHGPIAWVPFSIAELERRLNLGETVFIDFTASWCVTCQVNKKNAIEKESVIDRFDSGEVTPMLADWTTWDDEITSTLKKFGRAGVPLYVVFPGDAPDEPIILPELLTPGIITSAFDKAKAAGGQMEGNTMAAGEKAAEAPQNLSGK